MMSSTTAQRAGRAPKDKNKVQPVHVTAKTSTEVTKSPDSVVSKIQPTAEQLRIAQIVNDANKADYADFKVQVERIIEITGRTSDAALVALHDCDNDCNRAAIMLLEGNQDEGKWETTGKKKKNKQPPQQKQPEVNGHEPGPPAEKEEKDPIENNTRKRDSKPRDGNFRYRGPPRMNRGGNQGNRNWRNKENEKNERNLQEGQRGGRRERSNNMSNMEGGERTRGPRKNFSNGRGRGRGGRSRTFQNRGLSSNDGFPDSIDTWENSPSNRSAPNHADATMTVGNWSDVAVNAEEWSEEDWTENLTETKVFTPSANTQQQTAVSGLEIPSASGMNQNVQPSQSLMSQQIQQQAAQMQQQSAQFDFTQFAKQAADQIKAAVGVVTQPTASTQSAISGSYPNSTYQSSYNNSSSTAASQQQSHHVQMQSSSFTTAQQQSTAVHMPQDAVQQASSGVAAAKSAGSVAQAPLPQRVKPSKARLPPPSKIPESAVVMPDDAVTSLDVQFGALQFGTDSSPFDFTGGSDSTSNYSDLVQQTSNGSNHLSSQALASSITSQSYSNPLPSSVTMSKESTYSIGSHTSPSQNSISADLSQSQRVVSQDSMLLSQTEHKAVENVSSYVNHRTNQSSNLEGSLLNTSNKPDAQILNSYSTTPHDNSTSPYSSYNQKSSVLNSSNLGSGSNSSSVPSYNSSASLSADLSSVVQTAQQKYQVPTGQGSSTGYSSVPSSYGLQSSGYSTTTASGSQYASQAAYSSHGSGSYGSNNSAYSNQQGVYSGSVSTTTQSGTLMSTSVSASNKLTNSLSHNVKDATALLDSQHSSSQHSYEVSSTTSSPSVLSVSSTTSLNHSSQNSSNMLGMVSTSSSTTTTSVIKNSLSATGKAVPNVPQQNLQMLGHQYIMGQASLPFYGLQQPVYSYEDVQMIQSKLGTVGLQSPVYSYEDVQMLQSKLSTLGYYDMQFQNPPTTNMTARDPSMGGVAYTTDGKYSRADTDASTVATTLSQGQANTQAPGQAFLNPATFPPGYGYYFAGGMMPGGIHHYAAAPPIFPVPSASNTHGATTNTQFQKANAYGSHSYSSGYDSLSQGQDYSKGTYGAASQNQVKGVSGSGAVPDLSGSVYSKTHAAQLAKYNDKPGFHTGTPPPFNLTASQAAGPLGANNAPYATQFIPVLAHGQHHSTALLHHHMQGDGSQSGATPNTSQRVPQGLGQQKNSSKQNYAYWTSN